MDPTTALADIRAMIADYRTGIPPTHELVDLVDGLDRWLTRGGFLPDQWVMPGNYPLDSPVHGGVAVEVTDPTETLEALRLCETAFRAQRGQMLQLVAGLDRWMLTHPGQLPRQWIMNRT